MEEVFRQVLSAEEALTHLVTTLGEWEMFISRTHISDQGDENTLVIIFPMINDRWSASVYTSESSFDLRQLLFVSRLYRDATNNGRRGPSSSTEEGVIAPPSAIYKPLHRGMSAGTLG